MRVLVIGSGGVGMAVARTAAKWGLFEGVVMADYDKARAERAIAGAGDRFAACQVDASSEREVADLLRAERIDAVLNACDPRFVMPIFRAAFHCDVTYLDMAMSLSRPHPSDPYHTPGVKLGDEQFTMSEQWEQRGQLALCGMGVEPGLSDVFARYATDNLFSSIDEVGVRDGANLVVEGFDFCPTFSIWTTIEECLNPPIVWEKGRDWFTTEPFSEPETFVFPAGIGPIECVNVEHEEVLLVPRWVDADRVTFKYGLGDEFIGVLKTIHQLGLDSTTPVKVGNVEVSPRDVVAACLPDPAQIGDRTTGLTCAGTWVRGVGKDGSPREVYLHHVADNEQCMKEYGCQAVVWQTAMNPVVALELIESGTWSGKGVLGPEALPAEPFLERLDAHGVAWHCEERTPTTV
jgi:saccharopine dehydrogenase (NAD+, L-lysine forming)